MIIKRALYVVATVTLSMGIATNAHAATCDVVHGDSLWKIAKRYHVNFKELCNLNGHFADLDLIHPKDDVYLPHGSAGHATKETSAGDDIQNGNETPKQSESEQAEEILRLVNAERSKAGLQPLSLNHNLTSIAMAKAEDMRDKGYFAHQSPTYGSPFEMLQRFGVTYKAAGENIAAGQKTAKAVMTDWLNSSGHRANILGQYTELGVGYVEGGTYGTYWVQLFTK